MIGSDTTRRSFLKSMGAGPAALTSMATAGAAARAERQAVSVCMIGNRGHNGYVLDGLAQMPYASVVGICSGTAQDEMGKIRAWCDDHGQKPRAFADHRKMLDALKPDIVTVCGPFELRAQMCIDAFERGLPVFCEKTVAITLDDLERLEAAHAKAQVHFAPMMGLRYDPAFFAAWRAVGDGRIGDVRLINTRKSYVLGDRKDYFRKRATFGGTISWVGSHAIDWIHWYSGKKFQTVYAAHSTRANRGHGELEMTVLCHFTLEDEVFASATFDYCRPDKAGSHGDDRARIVGSEGIVEVAGGKVTLINGEQDGEQALAPHCDRQIFRDFVEHVRGETTSILGPKDTFAVTRACLFARQSADEDRIVRFA